MVLLYILLFVFVIYLYRILRFLFQRVSLLNEVKRFTKENNYTYTKPELSFFFPMNGSDKCAFLIETQKNIYNIKVVGMFKKYCELHFWSTEEYSFEKYYTRRELMDSPPLGTRSTKRHKIGKFYAVNYQNEKQEYKILLVSPSNRVVRLTKTEVNRLEYLRAGEYINHILFADSDFLLRYIEKNENK